MLKYERAYFLPSSARFAFRRGTRHWSGIDEVQLDAPLSSSFNFVVLTISLFFVVVRVSPPCQAQTSFNTTTSITTSSRA